jgi:DNA mismatch repair protein MutL
MATIQILDETTANQIAAGEVVERPSSVVKELVENAIDAGASHVRVELADAGKSLIRVIDDGSGMTQEEIILSLQRHATSKIVCAADLATVTSMGFRGEAVPSIASVSHMTVVSRPRGSSSATPASEVVILGGAIESAREVAAPDGTSITVQNLFYNVPARLKFLKTNTTELNQIVDLIQHFSLARPDISFRLYHGPSELFGSDGTGSLHDACVNVFGRDAARHLIPVEHETLGGMLITGFLGTPEVMRSSRGGQHFFVNRRFVRDRIMVKALDNGYESVQTIHGRQYPLAVLMITIDPTQVDVNVSPTKTEVRFLRESELFSGVYHAVQTTLIERGGLVPKIEEKFAPMAVVADPQESMMYVAPMHPVRPQESAAPASYNSPTYVSAFGLDAPASIKPPVYDPFDDIPAAASPVAEPSSSSAESISPPPAPAENSAPHRRGLESLQVLAQTRNMYIVAQTQDSLVLIDQHIAHERVLYERLLSGRGGKIPVQYLVVPITLDLGRREALIVQARLDELKRAGLELEAFGGDSFVVRAMPAAIAQRPHPLAVIRSIVDEMVETTVSRKLLVPAEEVLITASCKMAVKAGDPLSLQEMRALVADLLLCDNPYTCPHGRPIIIELSNQDLDRKFGRI